MRLVYLSPVPWASFTQRSHRFVEWFHARHGADVLWVDPYAARFPAWRDWRRVAGTRQRGTRDLAPRPAWLSVVKPCALPIEPLRALGPLHAHLWRRILRAVGDFAAGGDCLIGIGKPSELALRVLQRLPDAVSVLDAMDDFPAFYRGAARRAMEHRTRLVAARVSRILVSSEALRRRFGEHRAKLRLVRNACDVEDLPDAGVRATPAGRPVLGYIGTIGPWFDWRLVTTLAESAPALRIRLVGPTFAGPPRPLPGNVELLPACEHHAALRTMQGFSVGLIPFRRTDLTDAVDPIKYYEYRALGLPVLSTRFGEMARREREPGVFLVEARAALGPQVHRALRHRDSDDAIRLFRANNSWRVRFDATCSAVNAGRGPTGSARGGR